MAHWLGYWNFNLNSWDRMFSSCWLQLHLDFLSPYSMFYPSISPHRVQPWLRAWAYKMPLTSLQNSRALYFSTCLPFQIIKKINGVKKLRSCQAMNTLCLDVFYKRSNWLRFRKKGSIIASVSPETSVQKKTFANRAQQIYVDCPIQSEDVILITWQSWD